MVRKSKALTIVFLAAVVMFSWKPDSHGGSLKIPVAVVCKESSLYSNAVSFLSKQYYLAVYERNDLKPLLKEMAFRQGGLVEGLDNIKLKSIDYLVVFTKNNTEITSKIVRVKDGQVLGSWSGAVNRVITDTGDMFEAIAAKEKLSRLKTPFEGVEVSLTPYHGKTVFKKGEQLKFRVEASADGYLYVINIQPNGDIVFLLPNHFNEKFIIKANRGYWIPDVLKVNFTIQNPLGKEYIKVFVTTKPLDIKSLNGLSRGGGYYSVNRGSKMGFSRGVAVEMAQMGKREWGCSQFEIITKK